MNFSSGYNVLKNRFSFQNDPNPLFQTAISQDATMNIVYSTFSFSHSVGDVVIFRVYRCSITNALQPATSSFIAKH